MNMRLTEVDLYFCELRLGPEIVSGVLKVLMLLLPKIKLCNKMTLESLTSKHIRLEFYLQSLMGEAKISCSIWRSVCLIMRSSILV